MVSALSRSTPTIHRERPERDKSVSAEKADGRRPGAGSEKVHNRIAMLRTERGISRRQLAEAL